MLYKDEPTEEKKPGSGKFWCPNGRKPNLVVLCRLPHTENGGMPTDYTVGKDETITTENCCLDRCPWLKAHPEYRPEKQPSSHPHNTVL